MFTYPRILKRKDLKKISKYQCDDEIKDAYIKYLSNYSFKEFVKYCEDNNEKDLEDLIFSFTDLQLERFEPNSLIWVSHVMINFMIYFEVNLDYNEYYDAYATALQLTVLSCAMDMTLKKITFDEVPFPQYPEICFEKLFNAKPDFEFNLENDCNLAYKSFNTNFDFTSEEFYLKMKAHFDECSY
ncbi:hypothetical protein [Methanobrevibacter sp.]|uniref:hypothetical protein n=1 Tax=Methanobrevibacter sp. TaxID=66852 RepID=UPI0025FFC44D|nr:hypothetical protein [Methanobrevibacter sp.]MBR4447440.1 hypothetical protein [Methanobrevibacter sp.]